MQDDLSSLSSLLQATRNLLAFHRHCELDYPLSPALKTFLNPAPAKGKTQPFLPTPAAAAAKPVDTAGPDKADRQTLDDLKHALESCQQCPLGKSRQITSARDPSGRVWPCLSSVNPPGAEEEAASRPISGAPRELLEKMLGAINLSLDDIFLTNIVKCAPPAERGATAEETSACLPYLIRQIELIKPKIICTMGQLAGQSHAQNLPVSAQPAGTIP